MLQLNLNFYITFILFYYKMVITNSPIITLKPLIKIVQTRLNIYLKYKKGKIKKE